MEDMRRIGDGTLETGGFGHLLVRGGRVNARYRRKIYRMVRHNAGSGRKERRQTEMGMGEFEKGRGGGQRATRGQAIRRAMIALHGTVVVTSRLALVMEPRM